MGFLPLLLCATLVQAADHPVVALDQALNRLYQKQDAAAVEAFLAEGFTLVYDGGPPLDRAAFLARVGSKDVAMALHESTSVKVVALGDTAVLFGDLRQKGTVRGTPFDLRMKVCFTWVKAGDTWKVLAGHAAPLPEALQTPPVPLPKKK